MMVRCATPDEPTHLYILRCADGSYYVGTTRKRLEERVGEHNAGIPGSYTIRRRPVALLWAQDFQWATDAIAAERQIKRRSRAKKEALMRGDMDALRRLAKKEFDKPKPDARAPRYAPADRRGYSG